MQKPTVAYLLGTRDAFGYPEVFIMADGGCLCRKCVDKERRLIEEAILDPGTDKQWEVIDHDANWEDDSIYCDHCGGRIPSAYGDDSDSD